MENDLRTVSGLVMAGGRSSRFGSDKARHPVDGVPMLRRVYDVVRTVANPVFVGLSTGQPPVALPGAQVIHDDPAGIGPLGSVCAGLKSAPTSWLLVVATDLPYLSERDLRLLLDARASGIEAIVAEDGSGRRHPLCACFHRKTLAEALSAIEEGAFSVRGWIDRLAARTVTLPDRALRNANRPEDLDPDDRNSHGPL